MRDKINTVVRYEDNAEQRQAAGWCCKTCGRFYGDSEHMARYCCATDLPCGCGLRMNKGLVCCESCWSERQREKFTAFESRPYDGSAVVQFAGDQLFFDEDELLEWLADHCDVEEFRIEDVMLVFAEPRKAKWRRGAVSELLSDELAEDTEWDTSEIDDQISAWVDENAPTVYWPTKIRVETESLRKLIEEAAE